MVVTLFVIGVLLSSPAPGTEPVQLSQPEAVAASPVRVRSANGRIRLALRHGSAHSERFRELLETLGASDVIVHIEDGRCQVLEPAGCIQVAAAAKGARYLRIAVKAKASMLQLVPILAHELQHAVEIAEAPEVVDAATMQNYFGRIGQRRTKGVYETTQAIDVAAEVLRQLQAAP